MATTPSDNTDHHAIMVRKQLQMYVRTTHTRKHKSGSSQQKHLHAAAWRTHASMQRHEGGRGTTNAACVVLPNGDIAANFLSRRPLSLGPRPAFQRGRNRQLLRVFSFPTTTATTRTQAFTYSATMACKSTSTSPDTRSRKKSCLN